MVLKFHNDPTINEFEKKKKILEGEEGKTKLRGRETAETIISLKSDFTWLYL